MNTAQVVTLQPQAPSPQARTIHESNLALHDCLSNRDPPIPNEIILQILEDSSRWIRTEVITARLANENEPIYVSSHLQNRGQQQILATNPLSSLEITRLKRIVFTFRSRDQGWSDDFAHHQTFDASWTWMETSLTRHLSTACTGEEPDDQRQIKEAKESARYELQRNRHAGREPEDYRHELGADHELLRTVEEGDSIVLWARAMYPSWENRIYRAAIEVWCVDDLAGIMNSTA